MALLSLANLQFSFGDRTILSGVNLTLNAGDHVGLVGRNGCGKSTLLKLVAGTTKHKPDSGQIQLARNATAGYLTQDPDLDPERTLRDEAGHAFAELSRLHEQHEKVMHDMAEADGDELEKLMKKYERLEQQIQAAGGYAVDHLIDETLHGLGLTDDTFGVKVKDLSGGQRGRLALAKLLLTKPDLLLLDEPTNHLDIAGREWLEQFLAEYPGAVILISHDRWLLDRAVSKIYELELGELVEYPGNYHDFREQKAERLLAQGRAFEKQQTYIKQQQNFIDRYKAGQRAKQARGRESRLDRFKQDAMDRPVELDDINLRFTPNARPGDNIVVAENLSVTYDDKTLFKGVDVHIKRGDRVGIIGPNGAGKSTLVACLLDQLHTPQAKTTGHTKLGSQVDLGHYRQTQDHVPSEMSVVEYLMGFTEPRSEQRARDLAGAFLFSGDAQDKPLSVLSGGERARAVLAGLMCRGHNVLVLDEPTNHLDIPAAERLEDALRRYTANEQKYGQNKDTEGTLLLITHDRWLLDETVDQLYILDGRGGVEHFLGTYSEYAANRDGNILVDEKKPAPKAEPKPQPAPKAPKPENKPQQKTKPKKRNSRFGHLSQDKLEQQIEEYQTKLDEIDARLADPETYRDKDQFNQLQDERETIAGKLNPLETEWADRAEQA